MDQGALHYEGQPLSHIFPLAHLLITLCLQGYLNNPSATTNAITPDGWFKTGDIAVIDDEEYYYIVDRKKELIKYKVSTMYIIDHFDSQVDSHSYRASKVHAFSCFSPRQN